MSTRKARRKTHYSTDTTYDGKAIHMGRKYKRKMKAKYFGPKAGRPLF